MDLKKLQNKGKVNFININQIISILPDILQYFVSGYIAVLIFKWTAAKKVPLNMQIILSCVISFVTISIIKTFNKQIDIWTSTLIAVLIDLIASLVLGWIINQKITKNLFVNLFNLTPFESRWDNCIDYKNGSNLKVYMKNKDYYFYGHYKGHEDKGENSWFSITEPCQYKKSDNSVLCEWGETNQLVFRIKDVDYVIVE